MYRLKNMTNVLLYKETHFDKFKKGLEEELGEKKKLPLTYSGENLLFFVNVTASVHFEGSAEKC